MRLRCLLSRNIMLFANMMMLAISAVVIDGSAVGIGLGVAVGSGDG